MLSPKEQWEGKRDIHESSCHKVEHKKHTAEETAHREDSLHTRKKTILPLPPAANHQRQKPQKTQTIALQNYHTKSYLISIYPAT